MCVSTWKFYSDTNSRVAVIRRHKDRWFVTRSLRRTHWGVVENIFFQKNQIKQTNENRRVVNAKSESRSESNSPTDLWVIFVRVFGISSIDYKLRVPHKLQSSETVIHFLKMYVLLNVEYKWYGGSGSNRCGVSDKRRGVPLRSLKKHTITYFFMTNVRCIFFFFQFYWSKPDILLLNCLLPTPNSRSFLLLSLPNLFELCPATIVKNI